MRSLAVVCNQSQARICQTYHRLLRRLISSSFGFLSEHSSGLKGDRIIIPTELNGELIKLGHCEYKIGLDRKKIIQYIVYRK